MNKTFRVRQELRRRMAEIEKGAKQVAVYDETGFFHGLKIQFTPEEEKAHQEIWRTLKKMNSRLGIDR